MGICRRVFVGSMIDLVSPRKGENLTGANREWRGENGVMFFKADEDVIHGENDQGWKGSRSKGRRRSKGGGGERSAVLKAWWGRVLLINKHMLIGCVEGEWGWGKRKVYCSNQVSRTWRVNNVYFITCQGEATLRTRRINCK